MGTSPSTHRRAAHRKKDQTAEQLNMSVYGSKHDQLHQRYYRRGNQDKGATQEGIQLSDYTVQFTISFPLIPLNR